MMSLKQRLEKLKEILTKKGEAIVIYLPEKKVIKVTEIDFITNSWEDPYSYDAERYPVAYCPEDKKWYDLSDLRLPEEVV
jgi:hypothetical protein